MHFVPHRASGHSAYFVKHNNDFSFIKFLECHLYSVNTISEKFYGGEQEIPIRSYNGSFISAVSICGQQHTLNRKYNAKNVCLLRSLIW
jgi:hypothetical protein